MSETTTYPATCEIAVQRDGSMSKMTVAADPTTTPGLVITPETSPEGFTGNWALTHAATGMQIPLGWDSDDIFAARDYATALGATPVDWTGDLDSIKAQIKEHGDVIREARRTALYPPADPEGQWDGTPTEGPGAYPGTEAQATADQLARHLTRSLQFSAKRTHELVGRDDPDGRSIFMGHVHAKVAEWALVFALREFAKVDPQAADWAARQIWLGWEAGDSIDEEVWDWARGYGLPEIPLGEQHDEDDQTEPVAEAETVVSC